LSFSPCSAPETGSDAGWFLLGELYQHNWSWLRKYLELYSSVLAWIYMSANLVTSHRPALFLVSLAPYGGIWEVFWTFSCNSDGSPMLLFWMVFDYLGSLRFSFDLWEQKIRTVELDGKTIKLQIVSIFLTLVWVLWTLLMSEAHIFFR
jgi:hypothetical protein